MRTGEYFRVLTILHIAMLSGQFIFAFVVYYLVHYGGYRMENPELFDSFKLIIPIFTIAGITSSYFIFRQRVNKIRTGIDLSVKLREYRAALIIKYALLEAPFLLAVTGYLLTAAYVFMVLAGLTLIIFIVNKPTRNTLSFDLELSGSDKERINNPETEIN